MNRKIEIRTHLQCGFEDHNIARTLDPWLAVNLNGHVSIKVYLNVATL